MSDTDVIKVDSIEQAEKIILEHVNNVENYRDIAQITFNVNGTTKRFNPSQISKIKAKIEENQAQNGHDADKSMVFKMFRKDKNPTDVVIETGLNFDYVKKAHEEYLEFEGHEIVPKSWLENLVEIAGYVFVWTEEEKLSYINEAFSTAKESHLELEKHIFYCCKCGQETTIINNALKAASNYLSKSWGHVDCT